MVRRHILGVTAQKNRAQDDSVRPVLLLCLVIITSGQNGEMNSSTAEDCAAPQQEMVLHLYHKHKS
jgi:hypothetical protein